MAINRKRVVRLLRLMGSEAIYAKPKTSHPAPGHQIYPYLLRGLEVTGPDQVWCADITYVPMARGFMYLVAVMDWWSRYVLGWRLSNTLEAAFCVAAWEAALRAGRRAPLVSNTDQGSQFTSPMFIDAVESAGVDVSMDGRGRWIDKVLGFLNVNTFGEAAGALCGEQLQNGVQEFRIGLVGHVVMDVGSVWRHPNRKPV